jgi:hypothetical protein
VSDEQGKLAAEGKLTRRIRAVEVKPYHSDVTGSYVSDAALVFGE